MSIAGGTLGPPWNDSIAAYLNGGTIEYSLDGSVWQFYATIDGVTDLPGDSKNYYPQIIARYWRISRTAYLAIAEWRFFSEVAESIMPFEISGEFAELITENLETGIVLSIDATELTPELIESSYVFAVDSTELLVESLSANIQLTMNVTAITTTAFTFTFDTTPIYT